MFPGLSALVVHDLKNRLAIHEQRLTELLAAHPDLATELGLLRTDAVALQRRLVAFLTLYRVNAHELSANEQEEDPAHALAQAARFARTIAVRQGIEVEVDVSRAPADWFFDAYLIGLALEAAVDNAARYARSSIRLSARCEDGWLVLAVEDDGPGLDGEPVIATDGERTGLGTELCRAVARLHTNDGRSGELRLLDLCDDEGASGTRFELRLP
ncbi:MAG: sensor histidine kinase [Burkholderiales bacterium]